ncbi:hypothetical protein HU200_024601 [Digitaria exilis]|uniref:Uncharacterized protein n=1 Tax=Digitaria exilis TaxID=1010633 RepID=A0A835CAU5_9POAL|nr:hypothetical protein HU200_024601 [Digitaria exilis]
MEPDPVAVEASSLPPVASPTQQLQPRDDDDHGALECADPQLDERIPSAPDLQIAAMEPDPVAVEESSVPPAASPTQQLQPRGTIS